MIQLCSVVCQCQWFCFVFHIDGSISPMISVVLFEMKYCFFLFQQFTTFFDRTMYCMV